MSNKETKPVDKPKKDSTFTPEEFAYNNMLALPKGLKDYLSAQNLDWRFLNAMQFRRAGNYHRSHWKPFDAGETKGLVDGVTAEGIIQRGDLILGVRPKGISVKHRESLRQKAAAQSGVPRMHAQQLRAEIKSLGLGEHVSVKEGYGKDDDSGDDE